MHVSGNVGITGEMKISITVSFSQESITKIYQAVFPDETEDVTIFQVGDLVGEVTNMINGNMRRYLSEEDMKFDSSIPTVVVGAQQIYHPQGTIAKVIPFDMDGDFIYLEIGIKALPTRFDTQIAGGLGGALFAQSLLKKKLGTR